MRYRLIALDVDGTLLDDQHELAPETIDTIREVVTQGTEIVLCTGRAPLSTIPLMERMGLTGYVISHNGAATVDAATREIVHQYQVDVRDLEPYIDYCRDNGIHFDVNTAFGLYVDQLEGLKLEVRSMYEAFLMEPLQLPLWADLSEPLVKFTAFASMERLDEVYRDWSRWEQPFNMLRSGDFFIDLMHKQASKGEALHQLALRRGIASDEIMAIGNYYNDLSMLTYAGKGIAMANSPEEVRLAADEVTLSNNEQGVRHALIKHCLS
ncbi:Cof-type HAD-IIB family hydrolase [Paenibacillus sp. P96]|uniref:Cof-type HAD-IIB family hydrolase n=1 Tax=Paenibacillus zeirhizosphaerae TaxID=2987519 RepID=A0ABT9FSJ4_9BACL|nr:Cof-type HAD-IIB family hydrolase [Paenibacillus sp. P96]MDP4097713.1 Cof-type HAD-IIB family hydrolase [Paenibacillus sp. P96]